MAGMLLVIAGEASALDPFAIVKDPFGTHNLYSTTPAKALPLPRKKTRSDSDISLNGTPFGGPVSTPEALPAEPENKVSSGTTSSSMSTPRSSSKSQATQAPAFSSSTENSLSSSDIQSAADMGAADNAAKITSNRVKDSAQKNNPADSLPFGASPVSTQSSMAKDMQNTSNSMQSPVANKTKNNALNSPQSTAESISATHVATVPTQTVASKVNARVTTPDQTFTAATQTNAVSKSTQNSAPSAPVSIPTPPVVPTPMAPVSRRRPSIAASSYSDPCMDVVTDGNTIDLLQAVEHALCHNPETHQVWAQVKAQAAQVGIAKSAYLPTVELDASYTRGPNSYQVKDTPYLSYNAKTTTRSLGMNASWVLFDFGARRAHLDQAKQLLIAANASQDETLQKVFLQTAQTYYKSVTAQATLDATTEAETLARASFAEANAKYTAGVGTLSDQLQAQTNLSQAQLDRVKAYGELKNTQGELAMRMGLDASTPVSVISNANSLPDTGFVKSINLLIADAKAQNPGLIAAAAKVEAARASIRATRDEGRPTLSLIGNMNRDHQAGPPPADTDTRNSLVGVQLKVPIFDGFNHTYKVRAAEADLESKQAEFDKTEQQVALDVWQNYQNLSTETENLQVTETLVSNADRSYQIAAGRYKAGVGTMVELVSAQNTLAKAKSQRIQAQSNWQIARLKLANSLGHLGFWAL